MEKPPLPQYWIAVIVSIVISIVVLIIGIFTQTFLRAPIDGENIQRFESVQELKLPQPNWTLYEKLVKKGFSSQQ